MAEEDELTELEKSWNEARSFWRREEAKQDALRLKELEKNLVPSFRFDGTHYNFEEEYLNGRNPIGVEYIRKCFPLSFKEIGSGWNHLFVEPGLFILSAFKVAHFWQWKDGRKVPLGSGLLLLVKNEKEYQFVFIDSLCQTAAPERNLKTKQAEKWNNFKMTEECKFPLMKIGKRNWIHRHKDTVSLYLNDSVLISFNFGDNKKAVNCENEIIHYLQSSIDQRIVRIHGDSQEDQLNCYRFLSKNGEDQLKVIRENKASTKPSNWWKELFLFSPRGETERERPRECPLNRIVKLARASNRTQKTGDEVLSLRECVCQRVHRYLVKTCGLLNPLFRSSISFDIHTKFLCENILKDLTTLQTIVPFCDCGESKGHLSSRSQMEMILNTMALIQTCQRLHKCSQLYEKYKNSLTAIRTSVEDLFPLDQEIESTPTTKEKFSGCPNQSVFNLIFRMSNYLGMDGCDVTLFDKLDKKLRTSEMQSVFISRYDNFMSKFKALEEEAKNLPIFCEKVFPEPILRVPGVHNKKDCVLKSKMVSSRIVDKKMISDCLPMILLKIEHCRNNLHGIMDSVQTYLNFDITNWKLLWEKRQQLGLSRNSSISEASSSNSSSSENLEEFGSNSQIAKRHNWEKYHTYYENEINITREIGRGSYGAVSFSKHETIGDLAVKEFHPETSENEMEKEIDMLIRLQSNTNIVRFHGILLYSEEKPRITGILMEFIDRSLEDLIHGQKQGGITIKDEYTIEDALLQMKGLASAFTSIHFLGIIHRDIKPANILLKNRHHVQICDFGISTDVKQSNKTSEMGTHPYMSPEMIEGRDYDSKTDVYSLAITMWEMLHRSIPFEGKSIYRITTMVLEKQRPEIDERKCPRLIKNEITSAWMHNASIRPTMSELKGNLKRLLDGGLSKEILQTNVE